MFSILWFRTVRSLAREAIRSVTHLVLACSWSDAFNLNFEPKGAGQTSPTSLRLGFSWSSFFTRAAPKGQAARALLLRPTPVFRDPENFQCRAAFIQHQESLVSRQLYRLPRSNPFLTHGTVESPAKYVLCHHLKVRRAAASNQPRGLKVQPLCWLAAALKNQFFIVSVLFKENCRSPSVNRALASNTFPGYGSSQVHFCLVVTPGNMRLAS